MKWLETDQHTSIPPNKHNGIKYLTLEFKLTNVCAQIWTKLAIRNVFRYFIKGDNFYICFLLLDRRETATSVLNACQHYSFSNYASVSIELTPYYPSILQFIRGNTSKNNIAPLPLSQRLKAITDDYHHFLVQNILAWK